MSTAPRVRRHAIVRRYNFYAGTLNAPADHVISWHGSAEAAEAERQRLDDAEADKVYHLRHGEYARPEYAVMTRDEVIAANIDPGLARPKSLEGSTIMKFRVDDARRAKLDKIAAERNETPSQALRSLIDLY